MNSSTTSPLAPSSGVGVDADVECTEDAVLGAEEPGWDEEDGWSG
jgi:hypothetical protein